MGTWFETCHGKIWITFVGDISADNVISNNRHHARDTDIRIPTDSTELNWVKQFIDRVLNWYQLTRVSKWNIKKCWISKSFKVTYKKHIQILFFKYMDHGKSLAKMLVISSLHCGYGLCKVQFFLTCDEAVKHIDLWCFDHCDRFA